jgi:hypothetical protein
MTTLTAALGVEAQDLKAARRRVAEEESRIEAAIARLLDNLTPKTRDLAEERPAQTARAAG